MLRIYGSAKSRTLRVLWMVGELGIPYEQKDWLPRSPETRTPEYRALNPNARVPTIDDDGFVLSESMAINLYLAKPASQSALPFGPEARGARAAMELVGDRPSRSPARKLLPAYQGPSGSRAQAGDRGGGMEGSRAGVRRAGNRAHENRVARRARLFSGRSERRLGALSCARDRSREMAARQGLAQSLLGTPRREESARDAGEVSEGAATGSKIAERSHRHDRYRARGSYRHSRCGS